MSTKPTSLITIITYAPHGCTQSHNIPFFSREEARKRYDALLAAIKTPRPYPYNIENDRGAALAVNLEHFQACSLIHDEESPPAEIKKFTLHANGEPQ